jgi:hypothetical protein
LSQLHEGYESTVRGAGARAGSILAAWAAPGPLAMDRYKDGGPSHR